MKAPQTPFSQSLRKNQTPWEAKLWKQLRKKNLDGFKFKRQVPIGSYIVDFCCQKQKLIIELDGGQHAKNKTADIFRDKFLKSKRYKVLRFWNNEIDGNLESVLETIYKYLV